MWNVHVTLFDLVYQLHRILQFDFNLLLDSIQASSVIITWATAKKL
jgi:hypothetical protein